MNDNDKREGVGVGLPEKGVGAGSEAAHEPKPPKSSTRNPQLPQTKTMIHHDQKAQRVISTYFEDTARKWMVKDGSRESSLESVEGARSQRVVDVDEDGEDDEDRNQVVDDAITIKEEDLKQLAEEAYQFKLKTIQKTDDELPEKHRRKSLTIEQLNFRFFDKQIDFTLQLLAKIQHLSSGTAGLFSPSYIQRFGTSIGFGSSASTQRGAKHIGSRQLQKRGGFGEVLSTSTNYMHDGATATLNSTAKQLFDELADPETDTQPELLLKEQVIQVLHKDPKQRSKEGLLILGSFLQRYEFFNKFKKSNSEEAYIQLIQGVQILRMEKDQYVITQGDIGDKFYVLLKGELSVMKAYFTGVQNILQDYNDEIKEPEYIIYCFILALYHSNAKVFWERTPYNIGISNFIKKMQWYVKRNQVDGEPLKIRVGGLGLKPSKNQVNSSDNLSSNVPDSVIRDLTRTHDSQKIVDVQLPQFCIMIGEEPFTLPEKLMNRLLRLQKTLEFTHAILNKEVSKMKKGTEFGEIALNSSEVRQASISTNCPCILVYIEREQFQRVVKKALQREAQTKMQFVRANRIFEDVSTGRLQKLSYYMKAIKLVKNQSIYKEGDTVDGIYIIQSGILQYSKKIPYVKPISATTKNRWFEEQAKAIGVNQKSIQRQIAIFSISACIGFEEIFRQFILDFQKQQQERNSQAANIKGKGHMGRYQHKKNQEQKVDLVRDFTCKCESIHAEVLFLSTSLIQPIMKMHGIGLIEQLFRERRLILNKTLDNIDVIASKIAGEGLENLIEKKIVGSPSAKGQGEQSRQKEKQPRSQSPAHLRVPDNQSSMMNSSLNHTAALRYDGNNSQQEKQRFLQVGAKTEFFKTLQLSKTSGGGVTLQSSDSKQKNNDIGNGSILKNDTVDLLVDSFQGQQNNDQSDKTPRPQHLHQNSVFERQTNSSLINDLDGKDSHQLRQDSLDYQFGSTVAGAGAAEKEDGGDHKRQQMNSGVNSQIEQEPQITSQNAPIINNNNLVRQAESAVIIDNSQKAQHSAELQKLTTGRSGIRFPLINQVNQSQEYNQMKSSFKIQFPATASKSRLQNIRLTEAPSNMPRAIYQHKKMDSYFLGRSDGFPSPSFEKFVNRASSIEVIQQNLLPSQLQMRHQQPQLQPIRMHPMSGLQRPLLPKRSDSIGNQSFLDQLAEKSISKDTRNNKLLTTYQQISNDTYATPSQYINLKMTALNHVPDYSTHSYNKKTSKRVASSCITAGKGRRKDQGNNDFLQQLNELQKASEQHEKFEFAQNINKENVIDEKQFDFRGGKVRILNHKTMFNESHQGKLMMYVEEAGGSRDANESKSPCKSQSTSVPDQAATNSSLNQKHLSKNVLIHDEARDSSHLYLHDVKSFLNLRNAALNFKEKKRIENNAVERQGIKNYVTELTKNFNHLTHSKLHSSRNTNSTTTDGRNLLEMQKSIKNGQLVLGIYEGNSYRKTILQGAEEYNPDDQVTNQLNMKLIAVLQGLDTKKFYQRNCDGTLETERQQRNRINKSLEKNMNTIDQTFFGIEEQDKKRTFKSFSKRPGAKGEQNGARTKKSTRYKVDQANHIIIETNEQTPLKKPIHQFSQQQTSMHPQKGVSLPKNVQIMKINHEKYRSQRGSQTNYLERLRQSKVSILQESDGFQKEHYGEGTALSGHVAVGKNNSDVKVTQLIDQNSSLSQTNYEGILGTSKGPKKQKTPKIYDSHLDPAHKPPQSVAQTETMPQADIDPRLKNTDGSDYPDALNQAIVDPIGTISRDKSRCASKYPLNKHASQFQPRQNFETKRKNMFKRNVSRYHTNISQNIDSQIGSSPYGNQQVIIENQELSSEMRKARPDTNTDRHCGFSGDRAGQKIDGFVPSDHIQILTPNSDLIPLQARDIAASINNGVNISDENSRSPSISRKYHHTFKLDQNINRTSTNSQRPYVVNHRLQNSIVRSSRKNQESNNSKIGVKRC